VYIFFFGQITATPKPARRKLVASCQTRRSKGTGRFCTTIRMLRCLARMTGRQHEFWFGGQPHSLVRGKVADESAAVLRQHVQPVEMVSNKQQLRVGEVVQ